jgi:hypothetical protein
VVEAWQNRPLAAIYPIIYLDAIHIKLRREGRVENTAIYTVLGVDLEGTKMCWATGSAMAVKGPTSSSVSLRIFRPVELSKAITASYAKSRRIRHLFQHQRRCVSCST